MWPLPLPIALRDGERVGVRGQCEHGQGDCARRRRIISNNAAKVLTCRCPSPQPSPHGVKNAAGRGGAPRLAAPGSPLGGQNRLVRQLGCGPPSPHRSSRWGEGGVRGRCEHGRGDCARRRRIISNNAAKALTCRCPSPRPSPHGVKNAAGRGGAPFGGAGVSVGWAKSPGTAARLGPPSPHRSSRWGEGWGEGPMRARTGRLCSPAANHLEQCRKGSHVPLPLTPTLSPRREERRGERARPVWRRRGLRWVGKIAWYGSSDVANPLPIALCDGERVGVRGRCEHGRGDFARRRQIISNNAAKALTCRCPSPRPSPHGVKNAAGRGGARGEWRPSPARRAAAVNF